MDQLLANTDFAQHLVAFGACSQQVADELTQKAKKAWVPLGMMLVNAGKLRMKQVGEILKYQADDPKALFGDIAVKLGFVTNDELSEALHAQASRCPHVLDMAAADERIDREKYQEALRSYVRHVERRLDRLNDAVIEFRGRTAA